MIRHKKSGAGRAGALAVVFFLTLASEAMSQQIESNMPLYQIHGSGTSNPALLIWRVMDIMMARTKPRIAMSYRAIGSGAGGNEFARLHVSAFGCGDVPISTTNFNTVQGQSNPMMHVPFLVGTVSIFHNIPGIGEGLFLSPCTLAKVFRGAIEQWSDPDILKDNPGLPDLQKAGRIRVVHRNAGSSSTYAITHYFSRTCPEQWNNVRAGDPGASTGNRSVGVTTEWPNTTIEVINSQNMVAQIASVPYSIGYVESGQGLQAGLEEVAILGQNNKTLTSSSPGLVVDSFVQSLPLGDLTSANWTSVNPIFANTSDMQWPLTLGTYLYVRTNLAYLNETGSLLRLFISYLLHDDVAALMPEYGFIALNSTVRASLNQTIFNTITGLQPPTWSMENGTQAITGQQNFVFSPRTRDSYLVNTMATLAAENKETKSTLKLGDAYQVHGSGSFVSALMLRHAMQILQSRARVPISMTYRAVGSVAAQSEFADYHNMYASYNHFKVGDMPLPPALWSSLRSPAAAAAIDAPLQLPFALSALAIYHTKAVGRPSLVLNCSAMARLWGGTLSRWGDEALRQLNAGTFTTAEDSSTATITVFAMAAPSGATYALTGYLAASCGGEWRALVGEASSAGPLTNLSWPKAVKTRFNDVDITTPEQMRDAIAATPNAIGYLPVTLGSSSGLAEAQLQVPRRGAMLSATANLSQVVTQATAAIFSDPSADMATALGSSLYGQNDTWPMPMVQYLYMYRNLSGYGYSGPLLRAFVEFLLPGSLTGEGSQLAISSGLTPMPEAVQQALRSAAQAVALRTLTVSWETEAAGLDDAAAGAALYTFSANRESYDAYALGQLQAAVAGVQERLATGLATVLRVACTADTYGYIRLLRGDVQDMASSPIRILDEMAPAADIVALLQTSLTRASGGSTASDSATGAQLIVHPGALPDSTYRDLSKVAPVLQIPTSIRPVAVLYRGSAGLKLGLCTLARILNRTVVKWNDPAIQSDNPGASLPPNSITLLAAGVDDGDVRAVLQYIQKGAAGAGCPEYAQLSLPPNAAVSRNLLEDLAAAEPYTALALLAASSLVADKAAGRSLQAAALRSSRSGTFVTPLQTPSTLNDTNCAASGCPDAVGQAYTDAVEALVQAGLSSVPPALIGSWSGVQLAPLSGADVYPVIRFDFLIVPADVSNFGGDGAALRAVIEYATRPEAMYRMRQALSPYFAGLGAKALADLAIAARDSLQVAPGSERWNIIARTTADADQISNPATTLVLSRAPSLLGAALAGSLTDNLASSATLTTVGVQFQQQHLQLSQLAAQLQQDHQVLMQASRDAAQLQQDRDRLDRAYSIAVAALVLGLVLSALALALALYALAQLRGGAGRGASSAAGCLGPPAAKYEAQPGGNLEMRMLP